MTTCKKSTDFIPFAPYERDKFKAETEEYNTFQRTIYKIESFSLPKSAYEYLNPHRNEVLAGAGLVPPYICSGNIVGGYGINACIGSTGTVWVDNLKE